MEFSTTAEDMHALAAEHEQETIPAHVCNCGNCGGQKTVVATWGADPSYQATCEECEVSTRDMVEGWRGAADYADALRLHQKEYGTCEDRPPMPRFTATRVPHEQEVLDLTDYMGRA